MSYNIDAVYDALDEDILKKLLEVQSGVMAIGLYNQVCQDKEYGVGNLKCFMKSLIPKDKTPDFSHLWLDYKTLMNVCKNIKLHGYDFTNYNSEDKMSHKPMH